MLSALFPVRATGPKGSNFTLSHRCFSLTRVSGESKADFVFASLTEDKGPYEELLNTPEDSIMEQYLCFIW